MQPSERLNSSGETVCLAMLFAGELSIVVVDKTAHRDVERECKEVFQSVFGFLY